MENKPKLDHQTKFEHTIDDAISRQYDTTRPIITKNDVTDLKIKVGLCKTYDDLINVVNTYKRN